MEFSLSVNDLVFMLKGAGVTLALTFWAVALGTVLGLGFGVLRAEGRWYVSAPLGFVLDIFRSVPVLIQLVLFNSLISSMRLGWSSFHIACVVLSLYTAAYLTEIVRAGILSVPRTTRRAARSLGMTYAQDVRYIVLPLALRVALPNWVGLALSVMKDTSLVLWIGIIELLRASQSIITRTQEPLLVLSIAAAVYFAISFPISRLGSALERRWAKDD